MVSWGFSIDQLILHMGGMGASSQSAAGGRRGVLREEELEGDKIQKSVQKILNGSKGGEGKAENGESTATVT